jgi:hypothetical protein
MIRDGRIVCDGCQNTITKITQVPEEGWPQLHNLCSECFDAVWKTALQRV